jgi:lysophospholipase L1-like esterase
MNVSDQAVQATVRQIRAVGKAQGAAPGNFRIVGDATLVGIGGVDDPKANLGQYKAAFEPMIQFFAAGIKAATGPTARAGFTSADILNPARGTGPCQKKSPLECALEAKPALVFIDVGRSDITAKVPLDQFRNNLMTAVTAAVRQGTIPILVTITGAANPADEPKVAQYNDMIYDLAKAANVPLFNIYRIRGDDPTLINPENGELTSGQDKRIDLSPAGLKFGANVATLHMLELLSGLKAIVPLS